MNRPKIHLDRNMPLGAQTGKGHNRWHPDIEPAVRVDAGSSVEMETLDAVDGKVRPGSKPEDLAIDLNRAHPLTGPVYVEGAEPGDLLAVKIEQITTADHG